MYRSHPVRRIREDPAEGETVTLRITAESEAAADDVADRIDAIGTVEERLRFAGLRATVDQTDLDDVCAFEGIESIETADTFTLAVDEDPVDAGDGE